MENKIKNRQGDTKAKKQYIYPTGKTKPLRKRRSKPQVSEVFHLISIEICTNRVSLDQSFPGWVSHVFQGGIQVGIYVE